MKAEIYGRPEFNIELDLKTVQLLMVLSSVHYDSACKNAGTYGGFIHQWLNLVRFMKAEYPDKPCMVIAKLNQLDITTKVLEMLRDNVQSPDDIKRALEYRKAVHALLTKANECVPAWRVQLDV